MIIDYRRHRQAQKRGEGKRGAGIDSANEVTDDSALDTDDDVLSALQQLQERYPRKAEVVTLHVICGHSLPKVANMLEISRATAERDWSFAKAWLADALRSEKPR
jgi:DNA-directed RNA polymerase specialized sigma24 family protein